MSVRKREWKTEKGDTRIAWVVDYTDQSGARHIKTFKRKKDADVWSSKTSVQILEGTHVADSVSITVGEAGDLWIAEAEADDLERSTIMQYRQHLNIHIKPFLGAKRLTQLNGPAVKAFKDKLREEGRSKVLVGKVLKSLGSLISEAQENGLAAHNAVRDLSRKRRKGKKVLNDARQKNRLAEGKNYPKNEEIKAIIHSLEGQWRPLIITAVFTGLRASELRGLTWANIDFKNRKLHVCQRADAYNQIGSPKSKSANRKVPLSPFTLNTLREWKLKYPKGELDLVFPNRLGNIANIGSIVEQGLQPAQIRAGVVTPEGKAKYPGIHALRHFYASWCINRIEDGGMGLPPKMVQEYLGHASITLTMDVYGHLFPSPNMDEELAAAEKFLVG